MTQQFRRFCFRLLWIIVAVGAGSGILTANAQVDPRLTGTGVLTELDAGTQALASRKGDAGPALALSIAHLTQMSADLREALGNRAGKRLDQLGDAPQAMALRAHAAAVQVQAFMTSTADCGNTDLRSMAETLEASLAAIAAVKKSSKDDQPAVFGVEGVDHRAVFAIHAGEISPALILSGVNLGDASCNDPVLSATDAKGKLLPWQPIVSGVLPTQVDFSLPPGISPGTIYLHLRPNYKGHLFGCSKGPEAVVALAVVPATQAVLKYSVSGVCRTLDKHGKAQELPIAAVSGVLKPLTTAQPAANASVALGPCNDPVSYSLTVDATYGDGTTAHAGPLTQSAAAGITAGLPGGVSVSWDPSVTSIFAQIGADRCAGIGRPTTSPDPRATTTP